MLFRSCRSLSVTTSNNGNLPTKTGGSHRAARFSLLPLGMAKCLLFLLAPALFSQALSSLNGAITDPSGAAIPRADTPGVSPSRPANLALDLKPLAGVLKTELELWASYGAIAFAWQNGAKNELSN